MGWGEEGRRGGVVKVRQSGSERVKEKDEGKKERERRICDCHRGRTRQGKEKQE